MCSFTFSALFIFSVEKLWYTFKLICIFCIHVVPVSKSVQRDLDPESLDLSAPRATYCPVGQFSNAHRKSGKTRNQYLDLFCCPLVQVD